MIRIRCGLEFPVVISVSQKNEWDLIVVLNLLHQIFRIAAVYQATACARKETLFAPGEGLYAFCCKWLSVEYSNLKLLRLYAVIQT